MKRKFQSGFSLIELLVVIVVIGIIAALAVPSLLRAREAAENRAAIALLTTIRSSQMAFYAQKSRYARLDELQQSQNGSMRNDWLSPTSNLRGNFTYTLTFPAPPHDDADLKNRYQIVAARASYVYTLDQSGVIEGFEP